MKIITPGDLHASWSHRATCTHCGCVMEVSESDVHWHYEHIEAPTHPMHDSITSRVETTCPTCGKLVVVCDFDGLPFPVKERLRAKRNANGTRPRKA